MQTLYLLNMLLSILMACSVSAQQLLFRHYTQTDGLPSNSVTVLLQDSRGFLWIGTGGGLSMYDGYSFTNYDRRHGLPSADITCLLESKKNPGQLWVGTSGGGLAFLDGEKFRSVKISARGNANIVSSLVEDPSGAIWVATFGGLFLHDTTIHPVLVMPNLKTGAYVGLIDSINLCLAYADSLALLASNGELRSVRSLREHSHGYVTSMEVLREGGFVVATSDSNILRFDNSFELLQEARHNFRAITTIHEDMHGWLWFGTPNGLYSASREMLPKRDFTRYGKENGLPGNEISALLTDREGNFWVGNRGLLKLGTSKLLKFPMPEISSAYDNRRAVVDSAGHFWIATRSEELVEIWRTTSGGWRQHRHKELNASNALLFYDSDHRLWVKPRGKRLMFFKIVGVKDSPSLLSAGSVQIRGQDFTHNEWSTFIVTVDNHLWSSIGGVGIVHADLNNGNVLHVYGKEDGLPGDLSIRVVFEDNDRNIWLGGFQDGIGVALSDSGFRPPLKRITIDNGLPDNWIRAITQDRNGAIWIGTRRAGIAVQQGDSMRIISTLNGLASDAVWGLVEEGADVWTAAQSGFQQIRSATFDPVPMEKEFMVSGVGACGSDGKGTLWFATLDAFYIYDYTHDIRKSERPPVHITSVEVNGLSKQDPREIVATYDENNWTFTFVGLSFRHEGDLRYEYRLLGTDERWSPPSQTRSVSFSSLDPGEYDFQVRAITPNGTASTHPARLTFVIPPPFWATWWFRGCGALALFGAVGMAYRSRIAKVRRQAFAQRKFTEELLASQERERSRIAGELHDSLVQDLLVAKNRSLIGLQRHPDATQMERELKEVSVVLSRAISEVRDVAHNLRPYQLDRLGLTRAIQSLVAEVAESSSINMSIEADNIDQQFVGERSIQLYRILQEATNNIVRHSQASVAHIFIRRRQSSTEITVRDDGKGFSPDGLHFQGFGLTGIAQRVRMMGGTYSIDSAPGNGTVLHINVPIR